MPEDLTALFQPIADALGVPLDYDPNRADWVGYLTVDRIPLYMQSRRTEDRITFSIMHPSYIDSYGRKNVCRPRGNQETPRITVAKTRSPHAIAADLRRRCVEPAKPLYAEMLVSAAISEAQFTQQQATVRRLEALGGRTVSHDPTKVYGERHWDAECRHDSVTLTIRGIPADMAEYIVRYVTGNLGE